MPRAVFWVALAFWGTASSRAVEAPRAETLRPGVAVERTLTAEETHVFAAELAAGARFLVTVAQRGIDVVVEATMSDGKRIAVDAPTYRQSTETLLLPAAISGTVRVEVRSALRAVGPGGYAITLERLDGDDPRFEALAALTEAGRSSHERDTGTRRQAVAKYVEALAFWRRLGDPGREAEALLAIGSLHLETGDPRRAIDAYRLALPLYRSLGARAEEAIVLSDLGLAYWRAGDGEQARATLDQAITLQQRLGNRYGEAIARNNLCLGHHSRGELRAALACYDQALELLRKLGEQRWEAMLLSNLGNVYDGLGEPQSALASLEHALGRSAGNPVDQARTLNTLAVVYSQNGELQEALDRYGQALELLRRIGDRHREAVTLNNMGVAYYRLGEPQRATTYLERALALRQELGNQRGESVTLTALGRVHALLGEHATAMTRHRQALHLRQTLGDRRGEASSLILVGQGLAASGNPIAAIETFEEAVRIAEALEDRRETANALHARGAARLETGEPGQALPDLSRALDLRRAVGDRHGEARTLYALAHAERMLGRSRDAVRHAEAALDAIESLRTRVSDPELRATFLASQRNAYELAVDLLMERHAAEPDRGFARRALEISERAQARSLLDVLERAAAEARIAPALRERRSALLDRLNAKATRSQELLGRGREEQAAELELYSVLAELERVEAQIRAQSPMSAALTDPQPLRFEEIQRLLDPETVLLQYALGEPRSFLWFVTTESFAAFILPGRATIETAARDAHQQLATLNLRAANREAASDLARMLLGPVADRLDGRRLAVVADGALHYVPFATLPLAGAEPGRETEPLLTRHEVVHLPSASSLAQQRRHPDRRPRAPHRIAVVADPVFNGLGFDRLPSTRREAESIAELASPGEARLALGVDASRALVTGGDLTPYRIIHFATHGLIDASRPELSGLVLSGVDSKGVSREGFLRLRDIYHLELGADLVVLSGCRTAWGREIRGEGLVGLTRGFMAAGVPRVVASLWRVEDRVTAELMASFYRAMWQDGLTPAAALRRAQTSVARQRKWRDAYYWGAFVLQGDWR